MKLFRDLPEEALLVLARVGKWRDLGAGEIVPYSLYADTICFVMRGAFRISIMSPLGQHVTIRRVAAGDHFGEVCAFADMVQNDYNVIVDAPGSLLQISRADMQHLMSLYPALQQAIIASLAHTALVRSELIYEFAVLSTKLRLVAELLRLGVGSPIIDENIVIQPAPTHQSIATQIGTTREGVTRHMRTFVQQGLIRTKRGEITILDIGRMRAMLERSSGRRASYLIGAR